MAKLGLSNTNKIIGGVCGGIAEHFGWDATIIRILFAIAAVIGFGSPVIFYLVLWLIMKFS
ncbi:phage shock protein C [Catalinimonas alkaloidigena]|uniref:PspC domain-containing protein n=1 Tax=Catalinimonas alkaloidigena TaxID=1075417 RepID=UPI002406E0BB|nr:PspC domain-containing protein [Catalinimonas alkaloidigena]MDF9800380.1 phage shock protein C [Catalinimonas alkaloidigena]